MSRISNKVEARLGTLVKPSTEGKLEDRRVDGKQPDSFIRKQEAPNQRRTLGNNNWQGIADTFHGGIGSIFDPQKVHTDPVEPKSRVFKGSDEEDVRGFSKISGQIEVESVELPSDSKSIDLNSIRERLFVGISSGDWENLILSTVDSDIAKIRLVLRANRIQVEDLFDYRPNNITANQIYDIVAKSRGEGGFELQPTVAKNIAYLWAIKKAGKMDMNGTNAQEISNHFLRVARRISGKSFNGNGSNGIPIDLTSPDSLTQLVEYQLASLLVGKTNGQNRSIFERELVAYSLLAHVARFVLPKEGKRLISFVKELADNGDYSKGHIDTLDYSQQFEFYLLLASAHLDYLYAQQINSSENFLSIAGKSLKSARALLNVRDQVYREHIYLPEVRSATAFYMNSFGAAITRGIVLPSFAPY